MLQTLQNILLRRLEKLTGRTTEFSKNSTDSLRARGNALIANGDLVGAEALFRSALAIDSGSTPVIVCLGYVLKEQTRLSEARVILKRAAFPANESPAAFDAYYLLGQISEQQGDIGDALNCFGEALRLNPDFSRACEDLIRLKKTLGQQEGQLELLLQCVSLRPANADYRMYLAKYYVDRLDFKKGAEHLIHAAKLGVSSARINVDIGALLCRQGRENEAKKFFLMAEEMDPSVADESNFHLGYYYARSADVVSAIGSLERSIQHNNKYIPSHSLLLLVLSYGFEKAAITYEYAAKRFASVVKPIEKIPYSMELPPKKTDDKQLRIGFMSGEYRLHPVYFFLIDILKYINREHFHLVAYSNNPIDDDATTLLKQQFDEWYELRGFTNQQTADLIRTRQIDILVDLSGHTGDNKLAVYAMKPAPLQVSWLGYFASTGLEEMDYMLADPVSVPTNSQEWFSEKIVHLPETRLCMAVPTPSYEILVTPPPSLHNGYITFGTFQQATKITKEVLAVWWRVMQLTPNSRLRIQNEAINLDETRERICEDLKLAEIDLSRVDLVKSVSMDEYLAAHGTVDIVLDTFPYTGGTTTAFALWMGVPTVSLVGNTMLTRQGAMMLNCVGLKNLAVTSEDDYVAAAVRLASDTEGLRKLRLQLREVAVKSPLFDSKQFALHLQGAFRSMYNEKMKSL